MKDALSCVFDEMSIQKIKAMPLSNDTVSRRITDDIEIELISQLHACDVYASLITLCEDIGSGHHMTLLLHTEANCLPWENVLMRVVELRKELQSYFLDYKF